MFWGGGFDIFKIFYIFFSSFFFFYKDSMLM